MSVRKRGKPTDCFPPGASKKTKENQEVCLVCELVIKEGNDEPDETVYCEGDCQGWLHRKCVGMTKKLYLALSESDNPYICPHCKLTSYQDKINSLKGTIKTLLRYLKSKEEPTGTVATSIAQAPVPSTQLNQ